MEAKDMWQGCVVEIMRIQVVSDIFRGHESIKDELCSGRPLTLESDNKVEKVTAVVW